MEEEEQQVEYQSPDDTVSPNDEGNNQQAVDENIDGSELSPALADGEGIQEISTSRPISETAETSTSTEEAGEQNNDGQAQPQGEQQPTDSGEQPQKKSSDAKPATDAPSEPPKKPKLEIKARLNHAYMGGYRHKQTGTVYLHACTQTPRPELLRQLRAGQRFHRETQTINLHHRLTQTRKESSTQMARQDLHVNTINDRAMYAYQTKGRYISADEHIDRRIQAVTRIQAFYRGVKARRQVRQLKFQKWQYESGMTQRKEEREAFLRQLRIKAEHARTHPRTRRDFLMLYSSLETWRQSETEKIHRECANNEKKRLARLSELVDEEVVLLQKIDRLHLVADSVNSEHAVRQLLNRMTQSKTWRNQNVKGPIALENPMTIRARELKDLYDALEKPFAETKDRLQILLHVKYTVQEFSKPLTKDIIDLIDRESDLIGRGRSEDSMEGLRRRLSNLFLQFIKTPEFNPQAARFAKIPMEVLVSKQEYGYTKTTMMKFKPENDASLFSMCKYCQRQLPIDAFQYISGLKSAPRKCKDCHYCENIALRRLSDDGVERMVKWIRTEEERKQILIDQAWFHLTKMIGALLKSERERKNALLRVEGRMKVALGLFGMDPPSELPEPSTWPAAKKLTELEDDQSFTTLFTTQDIRLLVENIWSGQSSITMSNSNDPSKKGKRPVVNYDDLLLTRWDPLQPLSPWNCVLLTRKEAVSHDHNAFAIAIKQLQAQLGLITDEKALTESFYKIYSPVFLQRVQTKHIEAKNYFGSIVSSAALLHKQFDVPQKNDKEQEEVVVSEESASASRQKISEAQTTVAAQ